MMIKSYTTARESKDAISPNYLVLQESVVFCLLLKFRLWKRETFQCLALIIWNLMSKGDDLTWINGKNTASNCFLSIQPSALLSINLVKMSSEISSHDLLGRRYPSDTGNSGIYQLLSWHHLFLQSFLLILATVFYLTNQPKKIS